MKSLFCFLFCFIFSLNGKSQNKTGKNLRVPDSINISISNPFISKIDTVYFRDLNAEKKASDGFWIKIIPVLATLVGGAIALIGQAYLKRQDKKVNSYNLKEAKRINSIEEIFGFINKLSLLDRNNTDQIIQEVQDLEKYVNDNALYVNKSYQKIVKTICDYYKDVASDFGNKDYAIEMDLTAQLIKIFNK